MSLRCNLLSLGFVALASLPVAVQAQTSADDAVMDAAGRVYGNAMPMPALPMPALPMPAMPVTAATSDSHGPALVAPPETYSPVTGWDNPTWQQARIEWLAECRRRYPAGKGKTTLGAVIGGVLGGVAGNRIAGRGNRAVGTVAGAVLGGAAGGAIGNAADRNRSRDYCESYLDDYLSRQQAGGAAPGYWQPGYGQPSMTFGYAMQPVMMMAPVMVMTQPAARAQRPCTETVVTEEWVTVPARRRVIYRQVPDKRVRIVPDKRVRIN